MDDQVVIVINSKSYNVTKKKLIERSPYFKTMFNSNFLERNKTTVNIKGVDCNAWEEILYYLETGKMRPKPLNSTVHRGILRLLETSDMLLFRDIRELCLRSLVEVLSPENSLEILEVSSKLNIQTLIRKSRAVALWYADVITNTEAFYNLDVEHVEGYLSDPGLHSSYGERGVWEAVNRWIVAGPNSENSRTQYLPRLIKCVSLKYLSLSDLRTISLHAGVRSNEIVSAAVRGILDDDMIALDAYDFIQRWRSMPQRRLPLVPAVVAQVSLGSSSFSRCIVRFILEEKRFAPFLRFDEVEANLNIVMGFKAIANGSKIYILGGETTTIVQSWYLAVWEYDQILGHWNFLANLRKETRLATVCVLGNDLYVIGGYDRELRLQNTVSKLSLRDKKWTVCSPLPCPMSALPCCTFKGKIYAIKLDIYKYDPVLDMWERLDIDLPFCGVVFVAMANEEYIFIVGSHKTVYKFDPTQRNPYPVEVGKFFVECTQACLVDDYIYNMAESRDGLTCERMHIRSGKCEILWRGTAGREIDTFNPSHRHGCFPVLLY